MSNTEIVAKVNDLMHRGFEIPVEKLTPNATIFDELGLDSLDAVDMLVHLEENLGVKVNTEKLASVRTLQDIYDMVGGLAAQAQTQQKSELSH